MALGVFDLEDGELDWNRWKGLASLGPKKLAAPPSPATVSAQPLGPQNHTVWCLSTDDSSESRKWSPAPFAHPECQEAEGSGL